MSRTGRKVRDEALQHDLAERAGLAAEVNASRDGERDDDVAAAGAAETARGGSPAPTGPAAFPETRARDSPNG